MRIIFILLSGFMLSACSNSDPEIVSGYVEGEYVSVGAPEGGWIARLAVKRGDNVKSGDLLFVLDAEVQSAQDKQARAALAQAQAQLANLQKGQRPEQIQALNATMEQARAAERLAISDYERARQLKEKGHVSQAFLDIRATQLDQARLQVEQAAANLSLARQGARIDEVKSAKAAVEAAQAAIDRSGYLLKQRHVSAKVGGRIETIVRYAGELVQQGATVVQLLPMNGIKIRFFVPERQRAKIRVGREVSITCDGCGRELKARVTFMSASAEYTPPVIYSVGSREKLVWLVEAIPNADVHLSPGQPVDVALP